MPLSEKTEELNRLIGAFELEAGKFHPLTLSLLHITQEGPSFKRSFASPNHAIMLWQYYGAIQEAASIANFMENLESSSLKWGIRGAQLTCFGVIEGEQCQLFVRMAHRAGTLFDKDEAISLKSQMVQEILEGESTRHPSAKPTAVSNDNPLAIWLNFLLFHLSLTNPGREKSQRIDPDPFTLSLLALERLRSERSIMKVDKSTAPLSALNFKVALSFPGERRKYVAATVNALRPHLPPNAIFCDYDYKAQLAKPNLDLLLQDIYQNKAELLVVFLCEEYSKKQWCGLEWRVIRDLIKNKADDQVMFVKFDDSQVEGVLSIDGYVDARAHTPEELAQFILHRIEASAP